VPEDSALLGFCVELALLKEGAGSQLVRQKVPCPLVSIASWMTLYLYGFSKNLDTGYKFWPRHLHLSATSAA
jgi:hypothetical protein